LDSFHEFFSNVKIKYCIGRNGEPLMIKCEVIEPDEIETWNYFDNFGTPKKEEEDPSSQSEADDAQDETYSEGNGAETELLTELVDLKTEESQVAQPQRRKKGRMKKAKKVVSQKQKAPPVLSEKSLARKQRIDEREKLFREYNDMKCSICEFQFDCFTQVYSHFKRAHKIKEGYIICCKSKYRSAACLLDHIEWHRDPKRNKCEICGNSYKSSETLRNHIKRSHTVDPEPHKCPHCDKTFINQMLLYQHAKLHFFDNKTADVKCDICKKLFKSYTKMYAHKNHIHSGETFMCELCSKVCNSKSALLSHMAIHLPESEREYVKCELCDHVLQKGRAMKRHIQRIHNDTKQSCEICNKTLANRLALKSHMKTVHNPVYRFQCSYCDKGFMNRYKKADHEASNHTLVDIYNCKFCGYGS